MWGNGRLWSVGETRTVVTTRHPALLPYIRTEKSSGSDASLELRSEIALVQSSDPA